MVPAGPMAPEDKICIYVYRETNFKGGGRIHQLLLDDKPIGTLTDDNYYRLTLWPGDYHLTVHLPAETFLGEKNPPMSIGEPLRLDTRQAGSTLLYIYEDGQGFRSKPISQPALAGLAARRILAADLSTRDTARLKQFMNTRYDGPEKFSKPDGRGTLTWPDGSRYVGIFEHGIPTPKGRFYYPDGSFYMGRIFQGRPKGAGAWMDTDGKVLFAGRFVDEKPHGEGVRTGKQGPELCVFDHGEDVTPDIKALTSESVTDQEAQLLAFIYGDEGQIPEEEKPEPLSDESLNEGMPDERNASNDGAGASTNNQNEAVSKPLDRGQFELLLEETRLRRRWALRNMIVEEQTARIAERRAWCEKERSFQHKWCTCAPFDPEAGKWQECSR